MYNLHERIKVRAYYIHLETGKSSQECWLQAEKIEKKPWMNLEDLIQ